ncbi:MAG: Lactose transport system permease protein LacF [Anaerolineae bacterium]|nr:Lactose transport system permease protein LacF [Anaerolineae bacterium]
MKRITWERVVAILLLLPSVLAIALFVYGFIAFTAYASMTKWDSLVPDFSFVGFENYVKLFANTRFQIDIRNTVGFTVLFLIGCLTLGFLLAVLIDQRIRGEAIFRSIFLFPMAISFIVTGVVWRWLLNPGSIELGSTGINLLFEKVGLGFLRWGWFTDPTVWHIPPDSAVGQGLQQIGLGFLASPMVGISAGVVSLVLAATWQMSGYTMAMYLAGLRGIPEELREAARVDGASEWQVLWYIILPLLRPITLSAVIILGHISLKIYDLVVAMTGPGIGFSTDVPAFFMWDTTFRGNHFARGSSIAIVLLLMVAVLIVPYLIWTTRTEAEL